MRNQYSLPLKRGYKYYFTTGKIEVDYDTGCWVWLGAQYTDGYGKIRLPGGRSGMPVRAQAYFWHIYRGLTPGMDIGHNCHRRLCVRLHHLQPMTHVENMQLMFTYPLASIDKATVRLLWQDGFDHTYIAEKLMAPRPAIMKLLRMMDLHQQEFGFKL